MIPEKPLILRINSLMISRLESWKILKTISHLNSQTELIIKSSLDHWIRKISSLCLTKRSKHSSLHGRPMKKWNYLNLARLKLRKLLIRFMILSLVRGLLRDISMMKLSHKLSIPFWNSRLSLENSSFREFFLITLGTLGLFSVASHFSPDRGRCRFATEGVDFYSPSVSLCSPAPLAGSESSCHREWVKRTWRSR